MQYQIRFNKVFVSHFATAVILLGLSVASADNLISKEDCPTRDVSERLGEIRNQGNIGWCYANVAADLLTFRYHKELKGEQASAGYVAITFNEYTKLRPNDDAGLVSPAVWFSQWHGICPQSFQDRALKNSPFKTIREQINALVDLKTNYNELKKQRRGIEDVKVLETYRSSESYINHLSDEDLKEVLDKSNVRNFPRKLVDRLCRGYKVKVKPDFRVRFQLGFLEGWKQLIPNLLKGILNGKIEKTKVVGQIDLIHEINDEITHYNMTGISYQTKIFYEPTSEAYAKSGMHASSIVGQRWNDQHQRCEFKLRNSWGKNCASYTNPELKDMCDPSTGYVWVSESLLRSGISDMAYYRRAKK